MLGSSLSQIYYGQDVRQYPHCRTCLHKRAQVNTVQYSSNLVNSIRNELL